MSDELHYRQNRAMGSMRCRLTMCGLRPIRDRIDPGPWNIIKYTRYTERAVAKQVKRIPMHTHITIKNANEHNLKHVSLSLPRNQLIVFTGVSGSGKSSLAFDTIFAE